jgi:serine/threonine-protein kinase
MDRKTFLANLRQSGLMSSEEIRAVKGSLPKTERGRLIARALVEQGQLTKFQAELLLAGRTQGFLLGQYRILDELGQGGMGRVFKAVHQTMNRVVALKVLAPQLVKTEKAQRLFQREVRAAARLLHPNIVTAYDANKMGDRHYLVMEYVDGPNLDQLVRQRGPLPIGLACDLVRQVANGLQHAFEIGMVHRDIKPANILVQCGPQTGSGTPKTIGPGLGPGTAEGRAGPWVAKILDFGLARLHDGDSETAPAPALVRENVVMGTPDFLSPEQAQNLPQVDIRSDIYSLGCTLYYLLTAQVPFPGGTTLEKLIRHSTEDPVPLDQIRPDLPETVVALVGRLMARNIEDRFQTPAQAAEALAPLAVQGAPLWGTPSTTRREEDLGTATSSNIFSEMNDSAPPSPSGSALAGTEGPEGLATPFSEADLAFPGFRRRPTGSRGVGFKLLLSLAAAAVMGALGFAGWFFLR